MAPPSTPIEMRFWSKVIKTPTCWLWMGSRLKGKQTLPYGRIADAGRHGKILRAHRVSWTLAHQCAVPPAKLVLHRCDVPFCIRPSHLYLGSYKQNTKDALLKGRLRGWKVGEKCNLAKLSQQDVLTIRQLGKTGLSQREIARRFSVDQTNISHICRRLSWKHL